MLKVEERRSSRLDLPVEEPRIAPQAFQASDLARACQAVVERIGGLVVARGDGSYVLAARGAGLSRVSTYRSMVLVDTDLGDHVFMEDLRSMVAFHLEKAGQLRLQRTFRPRTH